MFSFITARKSSFSALLKQAENQAPDAHFGAPFDMLLLKLIPAYLLLTSIC